MHGDPDTVAMEQRELVLAGYDGDQGALVDAAHDSDAPELRARAIGAAARLGRRSVLDRVRDLRDDAPLVRRRACQLEACTPRRSVKVERELVERLGDADALVVVAAAGALGELESPAAVAALCDVASSHDDARCREAAVAALGAIGSPDGLAAVLGCLDDKPPVRRRAVVALAAFDGPAVEAALAHALEDRDWQVREVAQALLAAGTTTD